MDSHPLRFLRSLGRSREIATVLLNYGFADLVDRLGLVRYLQWGGRLIFWRKRKDPPHRRTTAERIRLSLESLGPSFVKFGQVLSTRPDIVPPDLLAELCHLQESCPPFPSSVAVEILERELNAPVSELFAEFDPEPLAAGSLAQVHRARHHDGTPLAIKIRRPNVVREIERDLGLMQELAILIERHIPEAQVFDPCGLVAHFSRSIRREVSFNREARTTDEFARLFRNDATLRVPRIFLDLCTDAIVTMEFIEGFRVADREPMLATGIEPASVAANGARIFMKQTFELGIFHGDPHPGNLRILKDGSICLLDFGMIGIMDEQKRELLVDMILAMTRRNEQGIVDVIKQIGRPFRPIDEPLLRVDVRDFVESYYGLPLERLQVGRMLSDFVTILSNHAIRCPGDLMLLLRALVTLEGVGRSLDPDFNLAQHLAPYLEEVVRSRYSPERILNKAKEKARLFAHMAHDLPLHLNTIAEKLSRDDLRIHLEHRGLDRLITEVDRSSNRVVIALVVSALVVASALIIRTSPQQVWLSVPVFILSSLLGAWLIWGVFRSGRL
jgi:ubiquinone biosynthesis protein